MVSAFVLVPVLHAATPAVAYTIDLTRPETHLVSVTLRAETHAGEELQFPAWNALYQIRDFIRNVQDLSAACNGRSVELQPVNVDTFRTAQPCPALDVHYQVFANKRGVFSSSLNSNHAFLNLAEILFYLPSARDDPASVHYVLPPEWKLITMIPRCGPGESFCARNYDALVDSPVEAGAFSLYSFSRDGALYRIAVRGGEGDYSPSLLIDTIKKITATEIALMRDRPFNRYTFIFHFPESGGGGGMEHSYGTAISFPAPLLSTNWEELENTIAHEFFHLWNVKRIRPQGLVPVDYIRGNDTRDLWFCEGVTSAYAELVLLRAGLISREDYYAHIAGAIGQLERRPARHFQSVELSGIDAWLEGYPDYFRPDRSISYYNKGELLGTVLDLEIRHASRNAHSLDDVMRRLNTDFAKRGRAFDDADLESIIASLGPSPDWVRRFFRGDIDGVAPLNWSKFLGYAGLSMVSSSASKPDWGLEAARGFGSAIRVISVEPGGPAAQAGVETGDVLVSVNGQRLVALPAYLSGLSPGQRIKLGVERGGREIKLKLRLGSKPVTTYEIREIPSPTPLELAVRNGWLDGTVSQRSSASAP